VNDLNPELARALLDEEIGTFQGCWRKENSVRQIFEMVVISAHPYLTLDAVVERSDVGVIEGPVLAGAVVLPSFKITLAESKRHGVPQLCFAAETAAALAIIARFAGFHDGNVTERKFKGQCVRIEIRACVDLRAAFEHQRVDAEAR